MKHSLTVACFHLKSVWQAVCRPFSEKRRRLSSLRYGSLRAALTALLLTPLGLLLAADTPKPSQAETFVTPKRDRAGMNSDVPSDKALPNVLILGDSISIGYTRQVREGLKGKANVIRPNANCGDTRHGLAQIETWLGDGNWQVIQFNWGQHALKWMQGKEYSREPREGYTRCIPLERYGAELEKLIMELKKTGRPLMWATTTPANNGSKPLAESVNRTMNPNFFHFSVNIPRPRAAFLA